MRFWFSKRSCVKKQKFDGIREGKPRYTLGLHRTMHPYACTPAHMNRHILTIKYAYYTYNMHTHSKKKNPQKVEFEQNLKECLTKGQSNGSYSPNHFLFF